MLGRRVERRDEPRASRYALSRDAGRSRSTPSPPTASTSPRRLADALPDADLFVSREAASPRRRRARASAAADGPDAGRDASPRYDCHVFVISVGAVVRMVAPLLENKKVDPAIVCVDDAARFADLRLSGHVGRGNAFTERVAAVLGATPVITTAVRRARHAHRRHPRPRARLDARRSRSQRHARLRRGRQRSAGAVRAGDRRAALVAGRALPEGVRYATSLDGVDPHGVGDPARGQRSRAARDPSSALRERRRLSPAEPGPRHRLRR